MEMHRQLIANVWRKLERFLRIHRHSVAGRCRI